MQYKIMQIHESGHSKMDTVDKTLIHNIAYEYSTKAEIYNEIDTIQWIQY